MTPQPFDSAAFLRKVLSERCQANPRYSMRAFARNLGLSPGGLSLILSRKKRLSTDRAHEIAQRLELDPKEAETFLLQVEYEGATSTFRKSELLGKLNQLRAVPAFDLGIDQFRMISEWYGLAVLTYFTEVSPAPDRTEAARTLGISVAEVDAMLERLQRLELIEPSGSKSGPRFKRVSGTVMVHARTPNEAMQNYYKALLRKAESSIDSQERDERASGSQVFAFDPSQLDEVHKLNDRYLNALGALAERGKKRTHVYQAFTHVFRVAGHPARARKERK